MTRARVLLPCAAVLLLASPAFAAPRSAPADLGWADGTADFVVHRWPDPVNVKNANFFLPNKDVSFPAPGFPLEIERSYNSRSTSDGPLGFGWSFNYDIYVRVGDDGLPEVVDADGFVCKFLPKGGEGAKNVYEASVNTFILAKKNADQQGGVGKPPAFYDSLKQRLMNDPKLLEQLKKELPNVQAEVNEGSYVSTTRGVQTLEVSKQGFRRTFANGITHLFYTMGPDGKARLRQMIDPAGHSLAMRYTKGATGDLVEVSHSDGPALEFTTGKFGKITSAKDPSGKQVFYKYNDRGDLVGFKDSSGRVTTYDYDEWHNMTKIVFPNGDTILNKYNSEKDWILAQKGPGDHLTSYEYGSDASDETHYWTVVDEDGVKTRYDYFDAQNRVVITDSKGNKTDRTFSECCGKPLQVIEADGRIVKYEYDKRGNATRIWDNKGQNIRYEYDPKWNKVTKVLTPKSTTIYQYDNQGNLIQGKDTGASGLTVKLEYTPDGRVRSVSDDRGNVFDFKYNAMGKPTQIGPRGGKG
ncbi:MAG TPA: DUF6531 domain-containing protein, partial [bacterium]|nr:DUF6531 domain-containing protein [bacterium]